jgi:hypothetical protein
MQSSYHYRYAPIVVEFDMQFHNVFVLYPNLTLNLTLNLNLTLLKQIAILLSRYNK